MSRQTQEVLRHVHRVRLPSKWSTIPTWEKLAQAEIERAIQEEGERAFEDLRLSIGDPEGRGPILRRRSLPGGGEIVQLTKESELRLKETWGLGQGFVQTDSLGRESLVRIFQTANGGLFEVGLSWMGLAGPLVEEWRNRRGEELNDVKRESATPFLFADLNQERRARLDRLTEHVRLWKAGPKVMEVILGAVSTYGRNPVEIPAEAFRVLLWPDNTKEGKYPAHWKRTVDGILTALNALTFHYRICGSPSAKGHGSFIGEWDYIGRGKGSHGDGTYILDVQPGFLGCLCLFESTKTFLTSGRDAMYLDFGKDLSQDERKELKKSGGYITFDAGRPFYNAVAGLTPSQENLVRWIEHQLTKKRDPARTENKRELVKSNAPDANLARRYDRRFCPLLPCGRFYYGALGHFRQNPETGFTLGGTSNRLSRRVNGMLAEMGYVLPSGPWSMRKDEIISSALGDLKAVVEEYYEGVVAGRVGEDWVLLETFPQLDDRTLCHKLKLSCFIPEDYRMNHRARFEQATGYLVTESAAKAEQAAREITDQNGNA